MPKAPKIKSLHILVISLEKHGMGGGGVKLIFCPQVNTKVFYKLIVSPSSQNSKSVMSLQYLIKKVKDEVDSLHADKHQSFLKVYFNTLGIRVS